jgi:hypothetical protein
MASFLDSQECTSGGGLLFVAPGGLRYPVSRGARPPPAYEFWQVERRLT